MALLTKVGSFAQPNATGHQSITGVGFQPKAVIFLGNGAAADGIGGSSSSDSQMPLYLGFGNGSISANMFDDDDFTSGDPQEDNGNVIHQVYGNGGTNTDRAKASLFSLDADGFTVNWTVAPSGTNVIVNYLALGGTELQVAITEPGVPSATGSWAITGAGFAPDAAIMLLGSSNGGSPEAAGFGFVSKQGTTLKQGTASSSYAPTTAGVYQRTDQAIAVIKGSTKIFEASLTSMDSDGMTLSVGTRGTFATSPTCAILWLKGVQIRSDAEVEPASTGNASFTGYGFKPKALLIGSVMKTAGTTIVQQGVNWLFGITDGTNHATISKLSNNNGNHVLDRTKPFRYPTDAGASTANSDVASFTSFDTDGFTFNFTTLNAQNQFLVMAFGDPASSGNSWTQSVSDSVTMSDAQSFARGLTIADSVTMAEALAKDYGFNLGDSVTMADALSLGYGLALADSATLADAITSFGYGRQVDDSVTASDALAFGYGLGLSDSATMADALAFGYGLALADAVTMSDVATPLLNGGGTNWTQNIDDTITLADVIAFGYGLGLSDAATLADALAFDRGLVVVESLPLADAMAFDRALTLGDTVTLADALAKGQGLGLADIVSIADGIASDRALTINDAVTLSDALSMLFNGQPLGAAQAAHVRSYFVTKFGFYT